MKNNWIVISIIVILAIVSGIAAAFGASNWMQGQAVAYQARGFNKGPSNYSPDGMMGRGWGGNNAYGRGGMTGRGWGENDDYGRGGMMGRAWENGGCTGDPSNCPMNPAGISRNSGERISMQQAEKAANEYLVSHSWTGSLAVDEMMEFENNFYALVVEKEGGKGAMELLVNPYSGAVRPEPGPNMMWNSKYGRMGWVGTTTTAESISQDKAKELAQQALDSRLSGAKIKGEGTVFYGYFTFDYEQNGKTAGMLSINAQTGAPWLHTWHGAFISENGVNE